MHIPISITVRPHLAKFLQFYYPDAPSIPLSRNKFPGYILMPLLEKTMNHSEKKYSSVTGVTVRFHIAEFDFARTGANVSKIKEFSFNEQLDDLFREQLFKGIELAIHAVEITHTSRTVKHESMQRYYKRKVTIVTKPPEIRTCILLFLQQHGIDESEISYETLKKDYYRWREKHNKKSKLFK